MSRQAYLIMAHHRPDLLQALLDAIDDPRDDVYLHIDRKSLGQMPPDRFHTAYSRLTVLPSQRVNWAGYSQIDCTLRLLEAAVTHGGYAYCHLLTGATYPLKTPEELHAFFDAHPGRQYMDLDEAVPVERVRYRWLFNEAGKMPVRSWRNKLRGAALRLQRRMGTDRFARFGKTCCKGLAYWSITEDLARYLVEEEQAIRAMMRHSHCGDEIFAQTMAYNSPFRDSLFDEAGRPSRSMRMSTWPLEDAGASRPDHNFVLADRKRLQAADDLFALKFEGPEGMQLIRALQQGRKEV